MLAPRPSLYSAALLTLVYLLSPHLQAAPTRQAIPVVAEPVLSEPYSRRIEALGTLKSSEAVTLSASDTKVIRAIYFDDGQRVKSGDILVEMASREEKALLEEAELLLSESQRQYQRTLSLHKRKLAADSELDQKRLSLDTARAKLEAMRARLSDRTIIAPFDGVMGLRQISLGALVKPGDAIANLDDDSEMKLDISIPALYLNAVEIGMEVEAIAADLQGQRFMGKVVSIDSRINPNTRAITVRALIDNPEQTLLSGMLMQTTLQQPSVDRLMLAEEALVQEGVNRYAFVVDQKQTPHTVEKRALITGDRLDGKVIVLEGLSLGEWVVTRGTMRLKNGTAVDIDPLPQSSSKPDDTDSNTGESQQ